MTKIIVIEKKAIELECKRCSYRWLYTGTNKFMASCPHCGTKIGIRKLLQQTEVGLGISTKQSVEVGTKIAKDGDSDHV